MYERFALLLKEKGITPYRVAKDTKIATATLSDWKNGRSVPKTDKLQKISEYLDVSLDYLTGKSDSRLNDGDSIQLNRKDNRDIEKLLADTREQLLTSEGLMFDGNPATEDEIQQILDAMQIGLEMAKKKNKEKFTPKKYRK